MLPLSSASTGLTMIRLLTDMPAGVLGLEAVGDVEKEDYEKVIVPAVEEAIAREARSGSSTYSGTSSTSTRQGLSGRI